MTTPAMEEYLEKIYTLIETKGYARTVEIAACLNVAPSSVTRMIRKLDANGLAIYEKYRDIHLTAEGKRLGQSIVEKHHILARFFQTLGVNDADAHSEIEQIEHVLSTPTALRIANLLHLLDKHPAISQSLPTYNWHRKK